MEGITVLAHGLKKNSGLRFIDLQDNTFTADGEVTGVEVWAGALQSWPELRVLNLSDCVLSGEGEVPALLETLVKSSNPELHTLQLQNNNLETATFELLAKHVGEKMGKLTRLELQWNDAEEDDESLENLALVLKARGGKLYVTDEDEEEEEEAEAEEPEEEEAKPKQVPTAVDKATDDLADLLNRVSLGN
jgi:Ran GTPase-activating protein 1